MPPRHSGYTSGDMMRMTRDAEQRVREMRERARAVAQNSDLPIPPLSRRQSGGWSTDPGRPRDFHLPTAPTPPPPSQEPQVTTPRQGAPHEAPPFEKSNPPSRNPHHTEQESPPSSTPPPKKDTTIIQDIVGAIGVEEDTLLILGLILILINQKSDTTLILALAYLLI